MALAPAQRRDLSLVAILRGFSYLGDAVALIALYLRLAHGNDASWGIAAVSIAAAMPLVVLAPIAGFVVDHFPLKRLLVALCLCEAVVCAGIGVWHGRLVTIGLMALLSCFVAFSFPGYSALVPKIAGEDNIARAQSLMQSVQGIAAVAGPGLGGLLVGVSGQSWPLYFDAISFAVAAVGTVLLRTDRRPEPGAVRPTKGQRDLGAGMRTLFGDQVLRPLVLTFLIFLLSLIVINVAEVFFITRTLHSSALVYGLVSTSFGVGNIVFVIGVSVGAIGLVEHVSYIFPLLALTGVAVGVVNVATTTLLTKRTPERLRGQMFAASNAIFTSAEIASTALGGLILTLIAPRTVFQVAGIVSTAAVLLLGPFTLRASRAARALELEGQGD